MNHARHVLLSGLCAVLLSLGGLGDLGAQVPFMLIADCADLHLMAYFDRHPEYEAVEAYVYLRGANDPFIRAIVSWHDGSQLDFVNRQPDRAGPAGTAFGRQVAVEPIRFSQASNKTDFFLSSALPDGQEIALDSRGLGQPDPAYGGLTDIGNHSPAGGWPLIYRDASSMGSAESSVRIGAVPYPIQAMPESSNAFSPPDAPS